jgi:hypothetical protein
MTPVTQSVTQIGSNGVLLRLVSSTSRSVKSGQFAAEYCPFWPFSEEPTPGTSNPRVVGSNPTGCANRSLKIRGARERTACSLLFRPTSRTRLQRLARSLLHACYWSSEGHAYLAETRRFHFAPKHQGSKRFRFVAAGESLRKTNLAIGPAIVLAVSVPFSAPRVRHVV